MTKQKKEKKSFKADPDSPFWHPKAEGETIKGVFQKFTRLRMGIALQLKTKEGVIPVGMSAVLKSIFREVFEGMEEGKTKLIIEYKGTKKSGQGRPMKLFDVTVDGKLIKGGDFPSAPEETVKEFFTKK